MIEIDKKQFQAWINALRSGKYRQTFDGYLQATPTKYCVLGVACREIIPDDELHQTHDLVDGIAVLSQDRAPLWLRLINEDFTARTEKSLTTLNDIDRLNFNELADLLEAVYILDVLN